MSNKDVAAKYCVPRDDSFITFAKIFRKTNISYPLIRTRTCVTTWAKSQDKSLASLEKECLNIKQKNTRDGDFQKVEKSVYTFFIRKDKSINTNRWCHS